MQRTACMGLIGARRDFPLIIDHQLVNIRDKIFAYIGTVAHTALCETTHPPIKVN